MMQCSTVFLSLIALMRLHRPVGIWLLLWPCWWGLALAQDGSPDMMLMIVFAMGAVLMRSAGCIINDLTDRDIDIHVARTRNRPLASGALHPYIAYVWLAFLLSLSLLILTFLHPVLFWWSIGAMGLVVAYPWMKRITGWPQAFLGITFNIGALFGWIAVHGEPAMAAWLLYAAGICWTIGYDTLYAHQDKEDDYRVGVRSTAITFGAYSKHIIALFYASAWLLLMTALWVSSPINLYQWLLLAFCALHLVWQVAGVHLENPTDCLKRFKSNIGLGGVIFIAILLMN